MKPIIATLSDRIAPVGFLLLCCLIALPRPAESASLMIWPTSLAIASNETATALWLENQGDREQVYQVRIFSWAQEKGQDRLAEQAQLIASPPMMRIAPGKRQLIRLFTLAAVPPGEEITYRVILDEIPMSQSPDESDRQTGVKLKMRYSLPLFVYGEGVSNPLLEESDGKADSPIVFDALRWRTVTEGGVTQLEIVNDSAVHVHLRDISFGTAKGPDASTPTLTGYVLPRSAMRWPLSKTLGPETILTATLNGKRRIVIAHSDSR